MFGYLWILADQQPNPGDPEVDQWLESIYNLLISIIATIGEYIVPIGHTIVCWVLDSLMSFSLTLVGWALAAAPSSLHSVDLTPVLRILGAADAWLPIHEVLGFLVSYVVYFVSVKIVKFILRAG